MINPTEFDVYEWLSVSKNFENTYTFFKRLALKQARKFAHDDYIALAEDMEMQAWITFLESNGSFLTTKHAMIDVWYKWTYRVAYRGKDTDYSHKYHSLNNPVFNSEGESNTEEIDLLIDSTFNTEEEAFYKQVYFKMKDAIANKHINRKKMTEYQQVQVKKLKKEGLSNREIGRRFNVDHNVIARILNEVEYPQDIKRRTQTSLLLDTLLLNGEPKLTFNDLKKLDLHRDRDNSVKIRLAEIREIYKEVTHENHA